MISPKIETGTDIPFVVGWAKGDWNKWYRAGGE
jgi:hypothetical protein